MDDSSDTEPPGPPPRGRREDDWIRNQLRRVYDATIRENIPSEMMDLLRQLDEAAAGCGENTTTRCPAGASRSPMSGPEADR